MGLTKEQIAKRVAKEMKEGDYINLGIGMPSLAANYVPEGVNVTFQTENGILGLGPYPLKKDADSDLTNASKQTVTVLPGGAITDSVEAFAMIRGGHIDITVLGGMQVDQEGNLANWKIPKKLVKGMGGAMDLVAGAKKVIVVMQHTNRKGVTKVLKKCTLPFTGKNCVSELYTDLAKFVFIDDKMVLKEYAPGVSLDEIKSKTEAEYVVSDDLKEMNLD